MQKAMTLYDRYGQLLRYLVVGGLTTGINLVVFFVLTSWSLSWALANVVAWLASVAFAFVANRKLVFESTKADRWAVLVEGASFFGLRLLSLLADMAILFVGITLMHQPTAAVKLIDQVVVIAANYLFSKAIFK